MNRTLLRNGTMPALRLLACGVFVTALGGCEGQIIDPNPPPARASWLSYKYPPNCTDCPELTDIREEIAYYCSIGVAGGSHAGGVDADNCSWGGFPSFTTFTLTTWKAANGFPATGAPAAQAIYGNLYDLRIGRDMNCVTSPNGNIACYVTNYGPAPFDPATDAVNPLWLGANNFPLLSQAIDDAIAGNAPFATVAMVYNQNAAVNQRPNAVTFYVFRGDGTPLLTPALDGEGGKTNPRMCMACHGGGYNSTTHSVTGAQFLPFDPFSFEHSSQAGYTLDDQQERYRKLNALVTATAPSAAIADFINGTYNNAVDTAGTLADGNYVPPGWAGQEKLYNSVYRPYCRMCHLASRTPFLTFAQFQQFAPAIEDKVCESADMPNAQVPLIGFRQDLVAQNDLRDFLTGAGLTDLHSCK